MKFEKPWAKWSRTIEPERYFPAAGRGLLAAAEIWKPLSCRGTAGKREIIGTRTSLFGPKEVLIASGL